MQIYRIRTGYPEMLISGTGYPAFRISGTTLIFRTGRWLQPPDVYDLGEPRKESTFNGRLLALEIGSDRIN